MDKKKINRIVTVNTATFFSIWVLIFLAGADKPPPVGFLWLVALVALLDVAMFFYLKFFIPKLWKKDKGLFRLNISCFLLGGAAVTLLTILLNVKLFSQVGMVSALFWVLSIMAAATVNAICFYAFNVVLVLRARAD
ncbi:hypothetical protein [Mesobacillus zeae]|uniref:Uncharacterized protein n=1 Tax=Mesobacillus zeae TaxID=1917180 RepID=A0A398B1V8_9BACI|nr:hypothetical protein [Mesobacillus zeae]RID81930.1 hypothetical protein D1970_20385 [Mesobacillus zeae]